MYQSAPITRKTEGLPTCSIPKLSSTFYAALSAKVDERTLLFKSLVSADFFFFLKKKNFTQKVTVNTFKMF